MTKIAYHWSRCWLCSLLLLLSSTSVSANNSRDYRLGSGDQIAIHVYGETDLTLETRLGEAGTVNYPYLGVIRIKGMTIGELERYVIAGLSGDYLISPSVHVSVLEYRPFYIYGEVRLPGAYPYQPGLTVERAVALAGGLTERASTKSMTLNRGTSGRDNTLKVSMSSAVKPDDSILIKDSFF